jgi:hypothetical protein
MTMTEAKNYARRVKDYTHLLDALDGIGLPKREDQLLVGDDRQQNDREGSRLVWVRNPTLHRT